MICNTCAYGGGERTALAIMNAMHDQGYKIELVDVTGGMNKEFKDHSPQKTIIYDRIDYNIIHDTDISFFHVNDSLWRLKMSKIDDTIYDWWVKANRKIISVNYSVFGLYKYQNADVFICQSELLKQSLVAELSLKPEDSNLITVLKPPSDISSLLKIDFRNFNNFRFIRHSSQGDTKYVNNINEQIDRIMSICKNANFYFMPAPSFLQPRITGVYDFEFNDIDIDKFLSIGNIFWYIVPKNKFIESGCNAVIEAMAAGLPVLCNNNGGLIDIVTNDIGWICHNDNEMYDIISKLTIDEVNKKGIAAREKAKQIANIKQWIKIIKGE